MTTEKGEFFLKGLTTKTTVKISIEDKLIQISFNDEKQKLFNSIQEELNRVSETSTLSIVGKDDADQLLDIAIDIKNLLSIGLGRRITFDRQQYWFDDKPKNVEKKMTKNYNEGKAIIPDFQIQEYLEQTLPRYRTFTDAEKKETFIISNYLNQTRQDFIEDRILRTVQAWECFAHYWIKEIELTDELKDLKKRIKGTYDEWKKESNYDDKNGEIYQRLKLSLDQEKLLLKLDKIVKQSGLKLEKIKLDLRVLKNLRDSVIHTGAINIDGKKAYTFLDPGVTGLQLIILKKLGYTGFVWETKEGFRDWAKIIEFFEV